VLERILHASPAWQFIFFGLGAITYAKHPEGSLEYGKRRSLNGIQRLLDRRAGRVPEAEQPIASTFVPADRGDGAAAVPNGDGATTTPNEVRTT
jgi:hypothetical protein